MIPPPPASKQSRTMCAAFGVLHAPDHSTLNWCALSDKSLVTGFVFHHHRCSRLPIPVMVRMKIDQSLSCFTGQPFPISIIDSFYQVIHFPLFASRLSIAPAPQPPVSQE